MKRPFLVATVLICIVLLSLAIFMANEGLHVFEEAGSDNITRSRVFSGHNGSYLVETPNKTYFLLRGGNIPLIMNRPSYRLGRFQVYRDADWDGDLLTTKFPAESNIATIKQGVISANIEIQDRIQHFEYRLP